MTKKDQINSPTRSLSFPRKGHQLLFRHGLMTMPLELLQTPHISERIPFLFCPPSIRFFWCPRMVPPQSEPIIPSPSTCGEMRPGARASPGGDLLRPSVRWERGSRGLAAGFPFSPSGYDLVCSRVRHKGGKAPSGIGKEPMHVKKGFTIKTEVEMQGLIVYS